MAKRNPEPRNLARPAEPRRRKPESSPRRKPAPSPRRKPGGDPRRSPSGGGPAEARADSSPHSGSEARLVEPLPELEAFDIESVVQIVRDGIIEFIKNAEPRELVEVTVRRPPNG